MPRARARGRAWRLIGASVTWLAHAAVPALAQVPPRRSCGVEIGEARASLLLRQCREVASPAGPGCRMERDCRAVRSEIERGCRERGADAPPFCEAFVEIDDDEDDD